LVNMGRGSVFLVAVVAIVIALDRTSSILGLVSNAWAGFGAAFGPLILMSLYWRRMNHWGALAGMLTGAVTVLLWIYGPFSIDGQTLDQWLYAMVPGVIGSSLAIVVVSLLTSAPKAAVDEQFDEMLKQMKQAQ
jgi:Na+/proline symporter